MADAAARRASVLAAQRRYREAHREELRAKDRARIAADPAAHRAKTRRWRERNEERAKEVSRDSMRRFRTKNSERNQANLEAWHKRNPGAYAAHNAVVVALRAGRLHKPGACAWCGREGVRLVAHHEDYSRPLDVEFICDRCHRRHHQDGAT